MKKKDMTLLASIAFAGIGLGAAAYTYAQKHPVKTRRIASDMKNMMKDFK